MPRVASKIDETFTIQNLDINKIHKKYGILTENEDIIGSDSDTQKNTTKLIELSKQKGTPECISFLDEAKKNHCCQISMIDFNSKMDINLLRYNCYWCRHPFDTVPIGCPIKYIPSQAEKTYYSQISRDKYRIKENITENKRKKIEETSDSISCTSEYYETDGVFCSFNCCKSWIKENKHNHTYSLSNSLLTKIYNQVMGSKDVEISYAPHWRTLEQYGGDLSIIKFRESFNKIDYTYQGVSRTLPNFRPVLQLYEENIKF